MHKRMTMLGLMALAAGLAWPTVQAQNSTSNTTRRSRPRTRRPPVDRGPAETRAERDQRLLRECRGKPNAGACEGYAR